MCLVQIKMDTQLSCFFAKHGFLKPPGTDIAEIGMKSFTEMDPNVKAIVTSGCSYDPVMANFKDYGFSAVIPNPYDVEELSEKLSEALSTSDE